MEINVKRRHIYALVLAIALIIAIIPVSSWAAHQFDDVPNDNIFHDDIGWLADNGVTKGCNPAEGNTKYCPSDNVTREQMAAFMRRLAVNKVVDAKTAIDATNAANAADADMLDGMDSTAFKGRLASASIPAMSAVTVPQAATTVLSVTGFEVPVSGGVVSVLAPMTFMQDGGSGANLGALFIEINGTGACDGTVITDGFAWFETANLVGQATASAVVAAPAGTHRFDVCTQQIGTPTTNVSGRMFVEWVPSASTAGVAGTSGGMTFAEFEDLGSGLLGG